MPIHLVLADTRENSGFLEFVVRMIQENAKCHLTNDWNLAVAGHEVPCCYR